MTDQRDIDRQREELRRTLQEIEDRVNPSKAFARTRRRIEENPGPWVAGAAGVVAVVSFIAAAASRRK